jgi:hypothetical protein
MCCSTGSATVSFKKRAKFSIGVSDRGRLRRETFRSDKRTRLAKSIFEQIWVRKSKYRRRSCLLLLCKTGRRQHRALASGKGHFARSHRTPLLFLLPRKVPKLYHPTSTERRRNRFHVRLDGRTLSQRNIETALSCPSTMERQRSRAMVASGLMPLQKTTCLAYMIAIHLLSSSYCSRNPTKLFLEGLFQRVYCNAQGTSVSSRSR